MKVIFKNKKNKHELDVIKLEFDLVEGKVWATMEGISKPIDFEMSPHDTIEVNQ